MPKVFIPRIQTMLLGPMPDNPPSIITSDKKYWAARKSLSYTLKKYSYFRNVASFKVSATTTGFYKSAPFDVGDDCGQPNPKSCYCKNIVTVTTSSQFKVTETISGKERSAEESNPPKNTKPPSIHELMCFYVTNNWYGKVQQKYRRTNALDGAFFSDNVSDRKEKKRNCRRDYDDDGNQISDNPDTSFWDYTVTFDSLLSMEVDYGYGNYLDDTNYTVQPSIDFGSTYNYMSWDTDTKPNCVIKNNGTLVFVGKTITSVVYGLGNACGNEGNMNMQETWTTSSKLKLVNN